MKIIYCVRDTNVIGGLTRIICLKANYLARQGHDVSIITINQRDSKPCYAFDSKIKHYDLGIDYEANGSRPFLKKIYYYLLNKRRHHTRLKRLLMSLRPDIAISTFCNHMSHLVEIHDGSKKILEFHGSRDIYDGPRGNGIQGLVEYRERKRLNAVSAKYDSFVVLTKEDMAKWDGIPKICQIYNATPFEKMPASTLDEKNVISVGRLSYEKGFDRLIEVWRIVHEHHPEWKLMIYGDGDQRESLQSIIEEYGLEESIFLKGATTDVRGAYREGSIYVLPSRTEGFPVCLLEAKSFGLPIVSFDIACGPKEIIQQGKDGFLVPDNDYQSMAESISMLIEDDDLRKRMGKEAYADSARFYEENIMKQWLQLFNILMNDE